MATTTISPNMLLPVPVVGVDSGPDFATQVNNALNIIDSHNHSLNSGVQITPSGLNINSDLSIQGHNLTSANSLNFINLTSTPTLAVGSLYELNNNLYWYSGGSLTVQMTNGGSLNVTSSGISSGTATASFVGGVLVVNEASNTPANIQAGSILFGNNISGSNFITLEPPSALASSYTLTLPAFNSSGNTQVMVLDTSGNMGSVSYDTVGQDMTSVGANAIASTMNSTGANAIASTMNSTGANAIAVSRTRAINTNLPGGIGVVNANASTSSTSPVFIANVQIITSGRPASISLQSELQATGPGFMGVSGTVSGVGSPQPWSMSAYYVISRSGFGNVAFGQASFSEVVYGGAYDNNYTYTVPVSLSAIDYGIQSAPGTYNYLLYMYVASSNISGATAFLENAQLVAYEL
jgi:hypothetical protein